jgi:hypothetical protein
VDASGNLYVGDAGNHRVLRFANAASLANGANADGVLGQPNFTSSGAATTQSGMYGPSGVAVDASGNLYVVDWRYNRVLRFANASSLANGANASGVLGQPNFTSGLSATTQSGMFFPFGVAVDASGNLYVGDQGDNRVLRFNASPSSAPDENLNTNVREFRLSQNYPNPFNPSTVIGYQLSVNSEVKLEVFDMLGRKVATLVNERQTVGSHQATFNAMSLSSGVYFYKLEARSADSRASATNGASSSFSQTKKMLLIK